jgi:uncharacterized protein
MRIEEIIWIERFVEKIEVKHHVTTDEVEEVLRNAPFVRRQQKGHIKGEDLYAAYGQADAGRYLMVFFIHKPNSAALPISARDMTESERKYYEQQKK